MPITLIDFVRESNSIEGILRDPTPCELETHEWFLSLAFISVHDLQSFVRNIQPNAVLRDQPGLNVHVGAHVPPPGGPEIRAKLGNLIWFVHQYNFAGRPKVAFNAHREYETLHPFTDGNGRSGRALWLWMMGGISKAPLGFLHHWYYQSLSAH